MGDQPRGGPPVSAESRFDEFYSARMPGLIHSLVLATGDLRRAEDCAQEAFIRAWQRWGRFRTEDPVAWVRAVAWRLCIDDWRSGRRMSPLSQKDDSASASEWSQMEAMSLLANLPHDQRAVVVLFYLEDLDVAGISEVLAIPTGTVKSRLSRARSALLSQLSHANEAD
jgi:RNA polymerase sigma-70 factor (ECF subfamily)